jgi:hypothetical protein
LIPLSVAARFIMTALKFRELAGTIAISRRLIPVTGQTPLPSIVAGDAIPERPLLCRAGAFLMGWPD